MHTSLAAGSWNLMDYKSERHTHREKLILHTHSAHTLAHTCRNVSVEMIAGLMTDRCDGCCSTTKSRCELGRIRTHAPIERWSVRTCCLYWRRRRILRRNSIRAVVVASLRVVRQANNTQHTHPSRTRCANIDDSCFGARERRCRCCRRSRIVVDSLLLQPAVDSRT